MRCSMKVLLRSPVWGGEPSRRRLHRHPLRLRSGQAGFSLLEVMIAATILAIMLLAMMVVLMASQDTFNTLATRASTQMRIQGALDRLVKEMRLGSQGNVSTGSPPTYLVEGHAYDNVTIVPVTGVMGGSTLLGPSVTYRFELDANEVATPGADGDGDGLIDEGRLIRTAEGTDTVLCGRVTGLIFIFSSDQLRISLTASAVDDNGYEHRFTGDSSISFRNQ